MVLRQSAPRIGRAGWALSRCTTTWWSSRPARPSFPSPPTPAPPTMPAPTTPAPTPTNGALQPSSQPWRRRFLERRCCCPTPARTTRTVPLGRRSKLTRQGPGGGIRTTSARRRPKSKWRKWGTLLRAPRAPPAIPRPPVEVPGRPAASATPAARAAAGRAMATKAAARRRARPDPHRTAAQRRCPIAGPAKRKAAGGRRRGRRRRARGHRGTSSPAAPALPAPALVAARLGQTTKRTTQNCLRL
mmetsp:Transcript_126309/g.404341  ORF Transcript_126309/g.404341 Transcript_126309/m.404341 type:complete len:245 (-) Transcript_126309:1503-2237(-)